MSTSTSRRWRWRSAVAGVAIAASVTSAVGVAAASPAGHPSSGQTVKPTIVLVHGAWADASSFAPVTAQLQRDGYTVLAAPNPLRGLAADAASVAAFVEQATTGPVVLVGHSYGGAVITNAAVDSPRVTALAYVDAYAPDQGETVAQLTGAKPGSALAADPATVFTPVQDPNLPAGDPDLYVRRDLFPSAFAPHLPKAVGQALAATQSPVAGGALQEPSGPPAWRTVPSWFYIGTEDRVIPAAEQRAMAARAGGTVVIGRSDHLSMLEDPAAVTRVIERAASAA